MIPDNRAVRPRKRGGDDRILIYMTADERGQGAPLLAIALGGASLIVLAMVSLIAIAMGGVMGGMMDGCGGMAGCHGSRGGAQTPAVVSGDTTITIKDFDYSPRDVTVPAGTTLTWANEDKAPHNATANDKSWETALLKEGESGSVRFDTPGEFGYYCTVHPYMKAKVTVTR